MTPAEPWPTLDESDALHLLHDGDLDIEGRLVDASNTTLRAMVSLDGVTRRCVYKPISGERPLWDFPHGTLAGREVSAYLISRATGWNLVPPTVLRDGPLGPGSCQLWIDEPEDVEPLIGFLSSATLPADWHPIAAARDTDGTAYTLAHADDPRLARLAVLDAVLNNADRKAGHVLTGADDRIHGIDHGVCLHVEDKLRTVLWGWAHRALPPEAIEILTQLTSALSGPLAGQLAPHLTKAEVTAASRRVSALLADPRFPPPSPDRPAVPWPPI